MSDVLTQEKGDFFVIFITIIFSLSGVVIHLWTKNIMTISCKLWILEPNLLIPELQTRFVCSIQVTVKLVLK